MANKKFQDLSPEEVTSLSPAMKAKYDAWKDRQDSNDGEDNELKAPADRNEEVQQIAKEYVEKHNKAYAYDTVIITPDNVVFPGTLKGDNSATNHCTDNRLPLEGIRTVTVR